MEHLDTQELDHSIERRFTDCAVIYWGITDALREDRGVDHATARFIASQVHSGERSALYTLAASGGLDAKVSGELEALRSTAPIEIEAWLDALREYIEIRADARPINRWLELWPTALLARPPIEQIGSSEQMGWFGLFRHSAQPGGFIFTKDALGCRSFIETKSDDDLLSHWRHIQDEYAYFTAVSEQTKGFHNFIR